VLVLSIILAWIIYITIEKPIEVIRRRRIEKNPLKLGVTSISMKTTLSGVKSFVHLEC
jgi:peptidoglycan/LPS O-acetylase OafA/YrhL